MPLAAATRLAEAGIRRPAGRSGGDDHTQAGPDGGAPRAAVGAAADGPQSAATGLRPGRGRRRAVPAGRVPGRHRGRVLARRAHLRPATSRGGAAAPGRRGPDPGRAVQQRAERGRGGHRTLACAGRAAAFGHADHGEHAGHLGCGGRPTGSGLAHRRRAARSPAARRNRGDVHRHRDRDLRRRRRRRRADRRLRAHPAAARPAAAGRLGVGLGADRAAVDAPPFS